MTPPAPRPRSVLFAITISIAAIALGVLATVDGAGASISSGGYPALALAVVGSGLLVGAWRGRSRGLIVVGLVLAVVTAGAVAGDRVTSTGRDRVDLTLRPTTVSELPATATYAVGSAVYDLTAIDFRNESAVAELSIGAGRLVVVVPPDVDVTVEASVDIGQADVFGQSGGGPGIDRTVTDVGADGPGGGSLDLTLGAGVGNVEVRRG